MFVLHPLPIPPNPSSIIYHGLVHRFRLTLHHSIYIIRYTSFDLHHSIYIMRYTYTPIFQQTIQHVKFQCTIQYNPCVVITTSKLRLPEIKFCTSLGRKRRSSNKNRKPRVSRHGGVITPICNDANVITTSEPANVITTTVTHAHVTAIIYKKKKYILCCADWRPSLQPHKQMNPLPISTFNHVLILVRQARLLATSFDVWFDIVPDPVLQFPLPIQTLPAHHDELLHAVLSTECIIHIGKHFCFHTFFAECHVGELAAKI